MAGRIGGGEKWEVKDGGMGGWGFVIGLFIVRVVYISRNVTRAVFNHQGPSAAEQPRSYGTAEVNPRMAGRTHG